MRTETRTAMMRRFARAVVAVLAFAGVLSAAGPVRGQEIQLTGPLKGAPAVRHLRYYREGRFSIAPAVSFTLLDEYKRTILVGARLEYNIKDWIALGVWGAYGAIQLTTDLTDQIDKIAPRDSLTAVNVNHTNPNLPFGTAPFKDQTAEIQYVVAPQLTFTPFRGKLAIFNKIFVDTDLYLAGGVGIVGVRERGECGTAKSPPCANPSTFGVVSSTKVAPTFGVGLTFYPGGFWSLGVEYRALPFAWNRAGFDTRGSGPNGNFPDGVVDSHDETFRFNQLLTIAIGFYIPTKPGISD
jgi:opacity protein-like surface antigen